MPARLLILVSVQSLIALGAAGCAPSATQGGFDSPNPAARAYAIEDSVQRDDKAATPQLIESLDSDDPLIRMMAITALQRMTGQTLGYIHYDSDLNRDDAVERWVQQEQLEPATPEPVQP